MENEIFQNTVSEKRYLKKTVSLLLSFMIIFSIIASIDLSVYAAISSDYEYQSLEDETIEIIGYRGTEDNLSIPSNIDGKQVTSIGNYAFQDCTSLTGITISNGVTNIGLSAFSGCTNLTNITIPDSVTSIGDEAFENTTFYNNQANWENGVLYIGKFLVDSEPEIIPSKITIKNGTVLIANYAFYKCKSLISIAIPNSVTNIGEFAYNGCTGLESVTIPSSVTDIGLGAFSNCTSLTSITISNSVKSIGIAVFFDCSSLENITIPNSVTNIGNSAFGRCTSLESITLPNSVTSVSDSAFYICDLLADVYYSGTKAQWEKISVGNDNDNLTEARIHCADGTINCVHIYDNGKVTKASTCTANGVKTYTCTACGVTKTETVKATGHKAVTDKAIAATCTKAGKTAGSHCSVCNAVITAQKTVAATGHKAVTDKAVAATCTKVGKTAGSHCSVCNAVITAQKTVAATGHTYDKGKITKAATCTATGTKTYTCTKCKATKKETIKATGHSYKTTVTKATTKKNGSSVTKCTKCGTVSKKSTIAYPKSVTLSTTSYTYDGKVKKPGVTVKDSAGKKIAASNYTVTYSSGRKNVGTYTVKVTFKGNYSGSVSKTFKINPKNTSISGLTAQSKAFTVKLKKHTTQTTGYQIQYSTSSNFKNAKTVTVKNTTTSKKVTGLSAKKKYYVRIRTYKTVGKTNYYSGWSKANTVTTKNASTSNVNGVGETVYITPTGKKYHALQSCAGKNAIKTTKTKAKTTYQPCSKCCK